jgi:hypothetical protein
MAVVENRLFVAIKAKKPKRQVKHYPAPFDRRKHIAYKKWVNLFQVGLVV